MTAQRECKKEVRRLNLSRPGAVNGHVGTGRPEPGEVVYLVSEVVGAGRIFEIGTRALVLDVTTDALVVEVGGDMLSCGAEQVAARRSRASRAAAWARPPAGVPWPAIA